ncbi:TPA: CPBP family intramembrane glutamic endopeptidase [Bacillus cereus]
MKKIYKDALKFSICMLPIGILGGVLTGMYSLNTMNKEVLDQLLFSMSKESYLLVLGIQTGILYTGVLGFFGYILAHKVNLMKKQSFTKRNIMITFFISIIGGLFLITDYFTFAKLVPEVATTYTKSNFSLIYLAASVVYGGILEEIMMRLFLMSLISFILWKIFARKKEKENIPVWIFVIANILSALIFAAGHIPGTIVMFGGLNGLILMRCLLLNGIFGVIFGWLYRNFGLRYAMIAHALSHIVHYVILSCFLL